LNDPVQYLIDRAAVSDTVARYFFALDRYDADAVRDTIADTFTLDAGQFAAPPAPQPAEEFIAELVERNWGFAGTIHINPNHLVELDGDSAKVTAYMWASHAVGDAPEDCFWGYGIYEIELVRTDDGWRLSALKIQPVRTEGGDPSRIFRIAAERRAAGEGH
jgi:hypothetical protein